MNRRFPSRLVLFADGAARPALPFHCRSAPAPKCQVREIRQHGRRLKMAVVVVAAAAVAVAAAVVVVVAAAVVVVKIHQQSRASFPLELSE